MVETTTPATLMLPLRPTDAPRLNAAAPGWFQWAIERPLESRRVHAGGCSVHYLYWPEDEPSADIGGLLFLHGGGAHANWWRFIAPFFTGRSRVAAIDLSGMGDSDARASYSATLRAEEIHAVLEDAGFFEEGRPPPILVGHSFGGLTAMRFAVENGKRLGGFVIAESPVRRPQAERAHFLGRSDVEPLMRVYDHYEDARVRFRLRPRQPCENDFIVEFIGRHSTRKVEGGWSWKFDPRALTRDRHAEPFRDYLREVTCQTAFIYGEDSAICTEEVLAYTAELLGPGTPFVGIPDGQHHLLLDQPPAFISALRALLEGWRSVA